MADMSWRITGKYTREMFEGNAPAGKGSKLLGGGYADRWDMVYGGGETVGDRIIHFDFNLSDKVSIFICGDVLNIRDYRHYYKYDEWVYCNKPSKAIYGTFNKRYQHTLEPERIKKYLNAKIPNCKAWDMVQARAKELYRLESGISL